MPLPPNPLVTSSTYISFEYVRSSPSGKTYLWRVENLSGTVLGTVSWYSKWRRYVFYPLSNNMLFDADCLTEIAVNLRAVTLDRQRQAARDKTLGSTGVKVARV